MTLLDSIMEELGNRQSATAIPAIPAILPASRSPEIAKIAEIAVATSENRENGAFPDGLNPATLTADLPDDPTLRSEVHRLLDRADELDRAGDEVGMVRILDDIRRTIQNATPAQEAEEAPRTDRVGKDEVTAATTPYNAPNAKAGDNAGNADPVPVRGAGPAITPPSDHADVVSERAAILEGDAGMTRPTAEREAVAAVGPCFVCGGGRFWVSRWGV
ncbi:MAG TPA: hypothetical protein PLP29_01305, partial [Candidatus Ozemobacteraceae bacterium]|nr:hypothetical protein [Candidatus Ozemobacteraceae bacterium]